jgi:hypothetical protein
METDRWKISTIEAINLGTSLRLIGTPDDRGGHLNQSWFQGDEKYFNVFTTHSDKNLTWAQITFRGYYIEWKPNRLTCGLTTDFETLENEYPASKMLNPHSELNKELVEVVLRILNESSKYAEIIETAAHIRNELTKIS